MTVFTGYETVPEYEPDADMHRRKIATALNNVISGKTNNVLDVTLSSGTTTTTVTDDRIGSTSFIGIMPLTATAATAIGAGVVYVSASTMKAGEAIITHDSSAATDRNFRLTIVG